MPALTSDFGDRAFGDSTKRLVVTSYNLGADDVYLFSTAHHPPAPRLRRRTDPRLRASNRGQQRRAAWFPARRPSSGWVDFSGTMLYAAQHG